MTTQTNAILENVISEIDASIAALQEAKQTIVSHHAGLSDDARVVNIPESAVNVVRNLPRLHER